MNYKNFFSNIILFTLSLFVMEGFLRLIDITDRKNDEVSSSIVSNSLTFKDYIPNSSFKRGASEIDGIEEIEVKINSLGIRGPEILEKKSIRYINIGDSFIQSDEINFDETFSELLNYKFKDSIQFIAHGISSWSPTPIFSWLYHKGVKLNPDKVNLFLCINDFYRPEVDGTSDAIYREYAIYNEEIPVGYTNRPSEIKVFGKIKSILKNIEIVRITYLVYTRLSSYQQNRSINKETFPFVKELTILEKNSKLWPEDLKDNVDQTINVIVSIGNFLKSKKIDFEVYVVPLGYAWENEYEESRRAFGLEKNKVIVQNGFENYLNETLSNKFGIISNNLSVDFNEYKRVNPNSYLYFSYDGHWNQNGHKLLSRIILKGLNK